MSSPVPVVPFGAGGQPRADAQATFELFVGEVAHRQLAEWLPSRPGRILDLSVRCPRLLGLMVDLGHTVVHADGHTRTLDIAPPPGAGRGPGRLDTVHADPRTIDWVADQSVDAVVAEGGTLSAALAAEMTLDDLHRVLRPGGGLWICVDNLVAGLSRLADQGRWAELADVPAADVVLIPDADGRVTRCFWPEELHTMLDAAGFDVEWIRPRAVLAEQTVTRALATDPGRMSALVETELALSARRQGESIGAHLVASARRR
jgi:hypothetical protein